MARGPELACKVKLYMLQTNLHGLLLKSLIICYLIVHNLNNAPICKRHLYFMRNAVKIKMSLFSWLQYEFAFKKLDPQKKICKVLSS